MAEVQELCKDTNTAISEHDVKGEALKEEAARRRQGVPNGEHQSTNASPDKGKGKQRAESVPITEDPTDDGLPKTPAGEDHRRKTLSLQSRLREYLILTHQVNFLLGDVYSILGQKYSAAEDSSYAEAENIRKRILKSVFSIVMKQCSSSDFLVETSNGGFGCPFYGDPSPKCVQEGRDRTRLDSRPL